MAGSVPDAADLVAGDGNLHTDVFLADMKSGDLVRVSEAAGGGDPNDSSSLFGSAISKNGRYVVYYSYATNIVAGDGNEASDVFLYDAVQGTTTLVSRNAAGTPSNGDSIYPSISANGRFVAYSSTASDLVAGGIGGNYDVYVYDTRTGTTSKASPGIDSAKAGGGCFRAAVSNSGRWVAFDSLAANLVPGDTNGAVDVFLFDRKTAAMRRVSVPAGGGEGNAASFGQVMSSSGKVLVFISSASDLVLDDANATDDLFRVDLRTGALTMLSKNELGTQGNGASDFFGPGLSSNGKYLAFTSDATNFVAGDANGASDVFLLRLK